MSRFDLNKPGDFAQAVTGSVGGLLSVFGEGRDPSQWDIVESSYKGVVFHVFQSKSEWQGAVSEVSDKGGRRKIPLKYPYRDGQTTDDLGREPEEFDMEIVIHGLRYKQGLDALLAVFNETTPGELVHPVRGRVTAVAHTWTLVHRSDARKSVAIRASFMEHNFSVLVREEKVDKSVKGAIAAALEGFQKIQSVILNINGAVKFGQSFVNKAAEAVYEFQVGFADVLAAINNKFNLDSIKDFPSLLPVNVGGTQSNTAAGTFAQDNFTTASASLSEVTVAALSAQEIAKKLSASRAALLAAIELMQQAGDGQGALEFYSDILELKRTGILLQNSYERGIAASQAKIITYTVPRLMTIRELAFANGLTMDGVIDIDLLNPSLMSVNFIEKGTLVRVPVS